MNYVLMYRSFGIPKITALRQGLIKNERSIERGRERNIGGYRKAVMRVTFGCDSREKAAVLHTCSPVVEVA